MASDGPSAGRAASSQGIMPPTETPAMAPPSALPSSTFASSTVPSRPPASSAPPFPSAPPVSLLAAHQHQHRANSRKPDATAIFRDYPPVDTAAIAAFHRQLPHYAATPLRCLPSIAAEVGVGQVFLKDESDRFGMPSFKILGASWAVYNALAKAMGLDTINPDGSMLSLETLAAAVRTYNDRCLHESGQRPLQIISTTEGNWGRALARMARYAGGVACRLYVPSFMPQSTQEILTREGADVRVVPGGNYDDCVAVVRAEADRDSSVLLLLDVGFEGYEEVAQWVVDGYSTMLVEADEQVREATDGRAATHVVVPVGAGSIAQAVTAHYRKQAEEVIKGEKDDEEDMDDKDEKYSKSGESVDGSNKKCPTSHAEAIWDGREKLPNKLRRRTAVLAVEADTAACLRASLAVGRRVTVATADTIMCGLNCGTLSQTAWPILQAGVDYCVAVSDRQAHVAVQQLWNADERAIVDDGDVDTKPVEGGRPGSKNGSNRVKKPRVSEAAGAGGVAAGPCGAATLAGLRKMCSEARDLLKLDGDSVVVLFCTEGAREYAVPFV
ncbi:hypothetical protein SBRCBS47491_007452 [Sporothrix bragantina]|uniref:Tryptophan synthase beta chain-like PALP domain-containing protein n=1 Tax=Sporothrix bragantina TaxID=671064 RepID=A0ABP0CEJ4_9PEZI